MGEPTTSFLVTKAKEGLTRIQGGQLLDVRASISLHLLTQLISSLQYVCTNSYEQFLFTAAFTLAFFGLLRFSEFTNITFKSTFMEVTIRWSKTDQKGTSVLLHIPFHAASYCPVRNMQRYLQQRPQAEFNHLFIHTNLKPLTRFQFNSVLKKSLHFAGVKGHIRSQSFRIWTGNSFIPTRGS
ncbi:uncharacterized protein LOC123562280 [Mercenaria mercenaria]|uniref:uncharacterized protein LOC123562280 n=1 Tax=Mercenaria mercenaria TaxID=6596 RepID=UPI00234ECC50|nr:uncharacterized protein LOC123562280 [Mercenaria mercenaria]